MVADEPTANLDSTTGDAILRLMRHMQEVYKISFLFSSHDPNLMKAADDLIAVRDGVVQAVRRKAPAVTAAPLDDADEMDDTDEDAGTAQGGTREPSTS